jgi:hypothetical protein
MRTGSKMLLFLLRREMKRFGKFTIKRNWWVGEARGLVRVTWDWCAEQSVHIFRYPAELLTKGNRHYSD